MGAARRKNILIAGAVATVVGITGALWYWSVSHKQVADNTVRLSGTIEAYQTNVSVTTPGRIAMLSIQDGQPVSRGQVLLQLDQGALQVKLKGADTTIAILNRQREQLLQFLQALADRIDHLPSPATHALANRHSHTFSSVKTPTDPGQSPDLEMLKKQIDELHKLKQEQLDGLNEAVCVEQSALTEAADTEHKAILQAYCSGKKALAEAKKAIDVPGHKIWPLTLIDKQRHRAYSEIFKAKDESVESQRKSAQDAVDSAMKSKEQSLQQGYCAKQKAIEEVFAAKEQSMDTLITVKERSDALAQKIQAKMAGVNAQISRAMERAMDAPEKLMIAGKTAELQRALVEAKTKLAALELQFVQALSARQDILEKQHEFTVTSPISGICSNTNVHAGEVCAPGQTLATLIDPKRVYMRGFVREVDLPRIRIGQPARIFVDGLKPALAAEVTAIDPQASFTPETVITKDDRVREVFGVRLHIIDPRGIAKPGVPADAEIVVGNQG